MGDTDERFKKLIDPNKYQVFLFACPAYIPFQFAIHPWFVVNKKGVLTRWEVGHTKEIASNYFGYIRSDGLPLFEGLPMLGYSLPYRWSGKRIKLLGSIEGDENSLAQRVADFIEKSTTAYPPRDRYRLGGPNSNTYIQWVLNHFPEWNVQLPRNAIGKNYRILSNTAKKIPLGVVHGRFQPPHNGHLRYVLAALLRADHVMIGICTPQICTEEEAERTGYPCAPHQNPFSFDERKGMIAAALAEKGIVPERYSFIPFPSDYHNIETIIPQRAVLLMSVTSASDNQKIAFLKQKGFQIETVLALPEESEREKGLHVRESARAGSSDWQNMLPKAVRMYIEKHNLHQKLSEKSN